MPPIAKRTSNTWPAFDIQISQSQIPSYSAVVVQSTSECISTWLEWQAYDSAGQWLENPRRRDLKTSRSREVSPPSMTSQEWRHVCCSRWLAGLLWIRVCAAINCLRMNYQTITSPRCYRGHNQNDNQNDDNKCSAINNCSSTKKYSLKKICKLKLSSHVLLYG